MNRTSLIVLGVLISVSMLFGLKQENAAGRLTTNKEVVLVAGQNLMVPQNQVDQMQIAPAKQVNAMAEDGIYQAKGTNSEYNGPVSRDCDGDCWDLTHTGIDTQWYLGSGAAADTFAIAFQGAVPCVVEEAYIQWYSTGNVTAFGAMCSDEAVAATNGTCAAIDLNEGIEWTRGMADFRPIGDLMTDPTPNTIEAYDASWSTLLDLGGSFTVGDPEDLSDTPPFLIVFVKGAEDPKPLAADVFSGQSFNWFAGPWTADGSWGDGYLWGNYQSAASVDNGLIDVAVLVKVRYPWGAPIAANPATLCNTYATSDVRQVEVDLFDDVDDFGVGVGDPDQVWFHWAIDGVEQAVQTLDDAVALDVGADGNGIYGWDIDYVAGAGSVITWWVSAIDNMDLESITTETAFTIMAPMYPDADLLVVQDNDHQYYVGQYEEVLDALNVVYEVWNVKANVGIDYSVINHGWENIIMYGWGNQSLPIIADEIDPGYGVFLDNGGDLLLADQDWFYGHALDPYPTPLAFGPGDPAYDWFGIGGGMNDPDDDGVSDNGGAGDTVITSLLAGLPDFELNNGAYGTLNWSDFMYPDFATPIYQGFDTEEILGTLYEEAARGSKRACLSFTADAAVDTTEDGVVYALEPFGQYVEFFVDFFDVQSPPNTWITDGPTGTVFNDMGQEVTGMAVDYNDDTVLSVEIAYSVDGVPAAPVAMTDNGDGSWTGTIPAQEGGVTVDYYIMATDDDGTAASGGDTYFVYAPASPVLQVLNCELDPGAYPGLYYFYEASMGDLWVWPDFWVGGVNEELLSYYDIVYEINTTGTWADFSDHYDIIAAWLADGNKQYFVAGDEMFGMLTGWGDTAYGPGDFWYDMGVAFVYNDIGTNSVDPSPLYAEDGNIISGMMYTGAMDLGATLMYDPDYEIGFTNWLDGFDAAEGAIPFLWEPGMDKAVGIANVWENGNKTVVMGIDPLAINSDPYEWWGAHEYGPTIQSYEWFLIPVDTCDCADGDVDCNQNVDILDIVMIVGYILGTVEFDDCQSVSGDANGDGNVDILDVVLIVSWILGGRGDDATVASINVEDGSVSIEANGWIGGVQMELTHSADFELQLTDDAMVAEYVTDGTTTTLVVINPSEGLFSTSDEFEISNVLVATTGGYIEAGINTPSEFALSPAYPNPFNPTTNIQFALPQNTDVQVVVFDMLGRQVAELANANYAAGYYTINWNATNQSSGVYIVRMIAGEFSATQKVMLVK